MLWSKKGEAMAEFQIPAHVQRELKYTKMIRKGAKGARAKRVQEWVSLHGFATVVDSDFGPATRRAVQNFQGSKGLTADGKVGRETWNQLIAPLERTMAATVAASASGPQAVLRVARQHLKEHPREVGGQNRGPWVRAYMDGNEGYPWAWCAGFVTFVMRQAYSLLDRSRPIRGSFSCDYLAAQGQAKDLFVSDRDIKAGRFDVDDFGAAAIFLVRRTSTDWVHTGFAYDIGGGIFSTVEGNTNDEGSREGYEVCTRIRGLAKKDFVLLP